MQKFTVRAILRTDKINKKGKCPVSICVTLNRGRTFHSTGLSISPTVWDEAKSRVKASTENASAYNTRIGNELARIEKELLQASDKGELTTRTAKASTRPIVDFYAYAEAMFVVMDGKGQKVTTRRYRNNIPSIRTYAGNTLGIADINHGWLKGYEAHCRTETHARTKKPKLIAQNTIWSRFKMLRKILLQAAKDGIIPICPLGESRGGYPMPVWEKVPKDYLTLSEVDSLVNLIGSEGLTPHEDKILSFSLIECTAAIRHSDWSRFKVETLIDGPALKVRTKKTGEPVYVPIMPGSRLERVLNHIEERGYVYTATESASANKTLKVLAKVAKISKPITTHTFRHTAATLFLEMGFSMETVAEILGVTMKVVVNYAKTTRQKVRNEFAKLGGL